MKYMLMMHAPRSEGAYKIDSWAPKDLEAHLGFMHRMDQELAAAGEKVAGEGLAPPSQAKVVRAGKNGAPIVTDGPFAESKEFLAGYWIVEVDRPERAYEIAAKASAAPGPGGKPMSIPFEVREVMTANVHRSDADGNV